MRCRPAVLRLAACASLFRLRPLSPSGFSLPASASSNGVKHRIARRHFSRQLIHPPSLFRRQRSRCTRAWLESSRWISGRTKSDLEVRNAKGGGKQAGAGVAEEHAERTLPGPRCGAGVVSGLIHQCVHTN